MYFDFRYNRTLCKAHVDRAKEFLATARFALDSGRLGALIDNLFSAAELAAKALLLDHPDPLLRRRPSHGYIHSRFNVAAKAGSVEVDQRNVFNELDSLRSKARYLRGELDLGAERASEMFTAISALVNRVDYK